MSMDVGILFKNALFVEPDVGLSSPTETKAAFVSSY